MRRIRLIVLVFLLTALLAAPLTGCAQSGGSDTEIRIACFPNITHAPALLAKAQGLFEAAFGADYTVSYRIFNAGPAEIEALFAGEVDIGYIGPVPAINGYVRSGGDLVIVSGCANGGAVLVATAGSGITSVGDLAGKKVAVPQLGNTQHLSLLQLLSENGLKTTSAGGDVDVYAVANSEIKSLMLTGGIDAALVPEPWGSRLTEEIGAEVVLDYDELWPDGNYSTAVVIVRTDFLTAHPELVEQFLQVHAAAITDINENPADARRLVNEQIAAETGAALSDSVLQTAFSRLKFTCDPARESIEAFIDLSISEGFITGCDDRDGLFLLETVERITAQ